MNLIYRMTPQFRREFNEVIKSQARILLQNSINTAKTDLRTGREYLDNARRLYAFLDKDLVFESTFEDVVRQYGIIFNFKRGMD